MKKAGHFVGKQRYTSKDIRFTRNRNDLFAIALGEPKGHVEIKTLGRAKMPALKVHDVSRSRLYI